MIVLGWLLDGTWMVIGLFVDGNWMYDLSDKSPYINPSQISMKIFAWYEIPDYEL